MYWENSCVYQYNQLMNTNFIETASERKFITRINKNIFLKNVKFLIIFDF